MPRIHLHRPRHPSDDEPEDFEPGSLPVEPDEGPIPDLIPDDPERERVIDADSELAGPDRLSRRHRRAPGASPRGGKAPLSDTGLALPHERDESLHHTSAAPDPVIAQAKRDLDAGMVDTDMRATAGLDAQRRAQLVPGHGGRPPRPGA
jgi:hypothetical protein